MVAINVLIPLFDQHMWLLMAMWWSILYIQDEVALPLKSQPSLRLQGT